MALTAELSVKFSARQTGANDLGTPVFKPVLEKILSFTSGTGVNQADLIFTDTRTIAASSSEDLDLAGELASAFGATITMVEVVGLIVVADPANTNNVVLGNATQAVPLLGGTTPTLSVKPGGIFVLFAPDASGQFAVGAGATDDLKVANSSSGSSVTYTIVVLGRSA